eukprot:gene23518-28524_t
MNHIPLDRRLGPCGLDIVDDGQTSCSSQSPGNMTPSFSSKKRPVFEAQEITRKRMMRMRRSYLTAEERKKEDREAEKRYQFTFTRMVSRDIRRQIALMHINAMNSLDTRLIKQFFDDFARPDLRCTNRMSPSIYGTPIDSPRTRDQVIDLWLDYIICKPDAVVKMLSHKVIRYYGSMSTEVQFIAHIRATNVTVLHNKPTNSSLESSLPRDTPDDSAVQTAPHVLLTPVNVIVYVSFHLDDRHLLTDIQVDGRFVPVPELSQHYANYTQNCAHEVIVKNGGNEVILPS